jgi:alpha-glutamyl/putrescinyl thymine pyrophosphorylase clade 1
MSTEARIHEFIDLAVERELIRQKRELGMPQPWTDNRVMQTTRLCNVFRDDDKTTVWLREHITERWRQRPGGSDSPALLTSIVAFRWFNLIETGEAILPYLDGTVPWSRREVQDILAERRRAGEPIFTGAFIVNSEPGKGKLESILECIERVRLEWRHYIGVNLGSMESAFRRLRTFPRLGEFMAYQAVRDLVHTDIVSTEDVNSWMRAGPGCARGLGWVLCEDMDRWSPSSERDQAEMILLGQRILECARQQEWDHEFTLQDVETWACEYAKIISVGRGARPKRKFRGTVQS